MEEHTATADEERDHEPRSMADHLIAMHEGATRKEDSEEYSGC